MRNHLLRGKYKLETKFIPIFGARICGFLSKKHGSVNGKKIPEGAILKALVSYIYVDILTNALEMAFMRTIFAILAVVTVTRA